MNPVPMPFFGREGGLMVEVILGENDRLDWALKQFRRKVKRSGLFKDMKKRRYYEKPSVARNRKKATARRRNARARDGQRSSGPRRSRGRDW